jgi:hypothetical protein
MATASAGRARPASFKVWYDLRTFECAKCNDVHTELVATDQSSEKAGWLASE